MILPIIICIGIVNHCITYILQVIHKVSVLVGKCLVISLCLFVCLLSLVIVEFAVDNSTNMIMFTISFRNF